MALQRRSDRGQLVNPAGGGPLPKLKIRRGADGNVEVEDPDGKAPTHAESRPDERPPEPADPRPTHNPHTQGF